MEVKDCKRVGGVGLFTTRKFKKGETVRVLNGEITDYPTKYTIHVGNNIHVLDEFGVFVNHSFQPSAKVDGFALVALHDLEEGDEITFNYNESEINMAAPFEVSGTKVCGKAVIEVIN